MCWFIRCIIIIIVNITVRSCHEHSNSGLHGATQTEGDYPEDVEVIPDKPPAYDDVIVCEDIVSIYGSFTFLASKSMIKINNPYKTYCKCT